MVLDEPKHWMAFILGIVVTVLGALPLLSSLKVIKFNVNFLTNILIVIGVYILIAAGLLLLIFAFMEDEHDKVISIIVSLIIIAVGVITTLHSMKVISFGIPMINQMVYNVMFVVEGILLIIAAFKMSL